MVHVKWVCVVWMFLCLLWGVYGFLAFVMAWCCLWSRQELFWGAFACFDGGCEMGICCLDVSLLVWKWGFKVLSSLFLCSLSLLFGGSFAFIVFWMGWCHFWYRQVFLWYLRVLVMDVKWIFVALIFLTCTYMGFTGLMACDWFLVCYYWICHYFYVQISICIFMLLDPGSPDLFVCYWATELVNFCRELLLLACLVIYCKWMVEKFALCTAKIIAMNHKTVIKWSLRLAYVNKVQTLK